MRNVCAVFLKQVKETFKNQAILIQFVLFLPSCWRMPFRWTICRSITL